MKKIYYITRTFPPFHKGGGAQMREGAVKYLCALGWNVIVVMPNYETCEVNVSNEMIRIPLQYNVKISLILERIGFYEDYLDKWVQSAYAYMKNKITSADIIFSTSGGELGTIKLGSYLKEEIGCKFIVNFRDPINYGYMRGLRKDKKFHVGRVKAHEKYMHNADLILTSSKFYANILEEHFDFLSDKIYNNYFGYVQKVNLSLYKKINSKKLRIAYAGIMGSTQKPELLYDIYKLAPFDIEIYFIGDYSNYKPLKDIKDPNIHLIDYLPHNEFLKFMIEYIDIGFVSLVNDYFSACVPSKIYEYINLGLPILGALPKGDAMNIINHYGVGCHYDDMIGLVKAVQKFKSTSFLEDKKRSVIDERQQWSMEEKIKEVDLLIKAFS